MAGLVFALSSEEDYLHALSQAAFPRVCRPPFAQLWQACGVLGVLVSSRVLQGVEGWLVKQTEALAHWMWCRSPVPPRSACQPHVRMPLWQLWHLEHDPESRGSREVQRFPAMAQN